MDGYQNQAFLGQKADEYSLAKKGRAEVSIFFFMISLYSFAIHLISPLFFLTIASLTFAAVAKEDESIA